MVHRRRRQALRTVRCRRQEKLSPESLGVPLLAKLPLVTEVRHAGDLGVPVGISDADGEAACAFRELAQKLDSLGPARIYRSELAVR